MLIFSKMLSGQRQLWGKNGFKTTKKTMLWLLVVHIKFICKEHTQNVFKLYMHLHLIVADVCWDARPSGFLVVYMHTFLLSLEIGKKFWIVFIYLCIFCIFILNKLIHSQNLATILQYSPCCVFDRDHLWYLRIYNPSLW